eukprot:1146986-Pelagomonas_calceolata.AAC.3
MSGYRNKAGCPSISDGFLISPLNRQRPIKSSAPVHVLPGCSLTAGAAGACICSLIFYLQENKRKKPTWAVENTPQSPLIKEKRTTRSEAPCIPSTCRQKPIARSLAGFPWPACGGKSAALQASHFAPLHTIRLQPNRIERWQNVLRVWAAQPRYQAQWPGFAAPPTYVLPLGCVEGEGDAHSLHHLHLLCGEVSIQVHTLGLGLHTHDMVEQHKCHRVQARESLCLFLLEVAHAGSRVLRSCIQHKESIRTEPESVSCVAWGGEQHPFRQGLVSNEGQQVQRGGRTQGGLRQRGGKGAGLHGNVPTGFSSQSHCAMINASTELHSRELHLCLPGSP